MHKLTEAYHLLLKYCANYAFPLVPGEDEPLKVKTGGLKGLARIICGARAMARSPKDANSLLLQ